MKFIKMLIKLLLSLISSIILIVLLFIASLFLKLHSSYIFSSFIIIAGLICIFFAINGLTKKNYKRLNLLIPGFLLISSICFIEPKTVALLKANPTNSTVYSVFRTNADNRKKEEDYNKVFKTAKYENITIYYHPDIEPSLKLINDYLRQAEEATSKIFLDTKLKPLSVKFDYDEARFKQLSLNLNNSLGVYLEDNHAIHIFVNDCYTDILSFGFSSSDFKRTVLHEYSHYKFHEFLDYNNIPSESIPTWFNEGISEYIGNRGPFRLDSPTELIPFKNLSSHENWNKLSNNTKGKIYSQAHFAVSKLIMLKGEASIRELILKAKGSNFDDAFKAVMGFTLEDYEKDLRKDMETDWKSYYKAIPSGTPGKVNLSWIQSLEEYVKRNPKNKQAIEDLNMLSKNYERQKNAN